MLTRTFAILLLLLSAVNSGYAATITEGTIRAWKGAVEKSRAALTATSNGIPFHTVSATEVRHPASQASMTVFSPDGSSHPVPSGYLHSWVGQLFIPEARAADVLAVLQDYRSYPEVYGPAVVSTEVLDRRGDVFRYCLRFVQKGFGVKAALRGTFQSDYHQVNGREGYSITEATELVELRNVDGETEEAVPQEKARGFVERSFTIVRYREAGHGTEVEVETLTLSREIPGSIRWIAMPLVHKFASQTMSATLTRLSDRVQVVAAHRVSASLAQGDSFLERP